MAVRTRRLGSLVTTATSADNPVYECPTDRTAILKDLRVLIGGAGCAATFYVSIAGGADIVFWVLGLGSPGVKVLDPPPWIVLQEGDEIRVATATTGGDSVQVYASGTELAGDPS